MKYEVGDIIPIYVYSLWYAAYDAKPTVSKEMIAAKVVDMGFGPAIMGLGEWDGHYIPLQNILYSWHCSVDAGNRNMADDCVDFFCLTPDPDYMEEFLAQCLGNLCSRIIRAERRGGKDGDQERNLQK